MTKEEAIQQLDYVLKIRNLSPNTRNMYRHYTKHFIDFSGKTTVEDIELRDAQNYIAMMLDRGDKPLSINTGLSAIRYFMEAVLGKVYTRRQFPNIQYRQTDPQLFSKEMIKQMLNTSDKRLRLIILLGVDCGFRASEVAKLRVSDIDSNKNIIMIHESKRGKTRCVKLSATCLQALREYWLLYRPNDYFFPGKDDREHVTTKTINHWFSQYLRTFDFYQEGMRYHTLRHSYATNMLDNGCDIFLLKKLLGHDSISSTARYIHMTTGDIENSFSLSDIWGLS